MAPDRPTISEIVPPSDHETPTAFSKWIRQNRNQILERVHQRGAVRLRGFDARNAEDFEKFNDAMGFRLMEYIRGNTPRTAVLNKVYTSTEIRNYVSIPLHNEMSYSSRFPALIAFCCLTKAPVGGETPIADMHEVWRQIPPRIRDTFEERELTYTQILGPKPRRLLKKTWTEMFNTQDKDVVERHCAAQGIKLEWGKRDRLRLKHVRPAVMRHPVNDKKIWFNQAHIFHPSFSCELRRIGMRFRALLLGRYETWCRRRNPDGYPYNCTYGDGEQIPLSDIEEIRDVLWSQAVTSPWQEGDIVLLDNIQMAHGRMPYEGPRLVLTSLIKEVACEEGKPDTPFPKIATNGSDASIESDVDAAP